MSIKAGEAIAMLTMTALFIAPWFIAGLYIWGWMVAVIGLVVVGYEIYATQKYDKTMSQLFWDFKKEHPKTAWGLFVCATLGWILLGFHLLG